MNDQDFPRIALIGYGVHGQRVARCIKEQIVVVCEKNTDIHGKIRNEIPNARIFSSVFDMDARDCDVVMEMSSLAGRRSVQQWALYHHIPVVFEKPLASNMENLQLFREGEYTVNFREIYHPVLIRARQLLEGRRKGITRIVLCRANTIAYDKIGTPHFRAGVVGGCLLDKAIHDIAAMSFSFLDTQQLAVSNITVSEAIVGVPRHATADIHYTEQVCPLYADIMFKVVADTHSLDVRLVSSWIGLDPCRLPGIDGKLFSKALWAPPEIRNLSDCTTEHSHSKLFTVEIEHAGGHRELTGSIFDLGGFTPFLQYKMHESGKSMRIFQMPLSPSRTATAPGQAVLVIAGMVPEDVTGAIQ